jgi:hypothetical protein
MRTKIVAALVGMLAACAPSADAGGSFITAGEDRIEFFQIVEAPDRSLSGSVILVTVTDAGKLDTKQFALTGAKEGKSLQIVLKSGAWGLGDAVFIGEEHGDRLRLTAAAANGGLASGTYTRATMTDFERANAYLSVVATGRAARKAETDAARRAEQAFEDRARYLDSMARETRSFIQDREDAVAFLARGKAAYASLESEMAALISSVPHATDPIDQRNAQIDLRNALMDAQYRANDIDRELADGISGHLAFANALQTKLAGFNNSCEADWNGVPSGVQPASVDRWTSSCRGLAAAIIEVGEAFSNAEELAALFRAELARSQERRATLMRP